MVEFRIEEVDEAWTKKFRNKAIGIHRHKKGVVTTVLKDRMKRHASVRKAKWGELKGVLESELSSVELQHCAWKKLD